MISETLESRFNGQLLQVRHAKVEEFADIVNLRVHPSVAPFQYAPGPDYTAYLHYVRGLQVANPDLNYGILSITLAGRFIGSVTVVRYVQTNVVAVGEQARDKPVSAGWDLDPAVWGNGYMTQALTLLFDRLFRNDDQMLIRSECFSNNWRCIRLLKNLGYQPVKMPLLNKIGIKLTRQCFAKHLRFELSKLDFDNRPRRVES